MRLSYQFFQSLPRVSSLTARYGLAIVSSGVILFVCILLDKVVTGNVPLILLIIPVSVSALLGGFGPGLLATALCGLASPYFLTQPHFTIRFMDTSEWERLALFLATSVLMSWLIETAHMARQEVEDRAREAEQRQSELEAQISERERARAERERLTAELEMERARLKAIVENIPAGVLLAEAPSGRIVMGNPQLEQILGHPLVLSPNIESYRDWLAYYVNGRRVEGHESVLGRALQGEIVTGQ